MCGCVYNDPVAEIAASLPLGHIAPEPFSMFLEIGLFSPIQGEQVESLLRLSTNLQFNYNALQKNDNVIWDDIYALIRYFINLEVSMEEQQSCPKNG